MDARTRIIDRPERPPLPDAVAAEEIGVLRGGVAEIGAREGGVPEAARLDDAAPAAANAVGANRPATTRPKAARRTRTASTLPGGFGEPPLDPAGETSPIARRGVAWRWLVGGVLTGATGALLIGAAIVVAIEGSTAVVAPPERLTAERASSLGDTSDGPAAKGDLLVRTSLTVTATSSFSAPMTHRVGERELVRVQSFTRIATGLSQTTGVHATDIPRFDPMRYLAEGDDAAAEPMQAQADIDPQEADVAFVRRAFDEVEADPRSPTLSDADAMAQVAEERRLQLAAGRRPIPLPAQALLGRTVSRPSEIPGLGAFAAIDDGLFDSIEVRVIPENVTTLMKRDPAEREVEPEEIGLVIGRDQTLAGVLAGEGVAADDIAGAIAALGGAQVTDALPFGQNLRVLLAPAERPGDPRRLLRVVLFGENGIEAIAAVTDTHRFVSVDLPETEEEPDTAVAEVEGAGGARLYESLFETAMKHGLERETVDELIQVFAYDVDFQRRVQAGDTIDVFFTRPEDDAPIEILSAALTVGGETRRVYRFRSPEDNTIAYFDEDGRSLKKFLMRKPVADGRLTSGFGMRRHPVLRYARMHTGVDWAARVGVPIYAAGAGTITVAGWEGGYGRRIEIQHANGYVTTYSHMSRFADGMEPGTRVTQGQIIGYIGNSGLSTGPHLHYEVMVNGRFVDPLKIRVPRSRELDGRELADFLRQREQIVELMDRAGGPARLAAVSDD